MKTYRVYFIDANDGYPNQKLLEADCTKEVRTYMASLGHTDIEIEEVAP